MHTLTLEVVSRTKGVTLTHRRTRVALGRNKLGGIGRVVLLTTTSQAGWGCMHSQRTSISIHHRTPIVIVTLIIPIIITRTNRIILTQISTWTRSSNSHIQMDNLDRMAEQTTIRNQSRDTTLLGSSRRDTNSTLPRMRINPTTVFRHLTLYRLPRTMRK